MRLAMIARCLDRGRIIEHMKRNGIPPTCAIYELFINSIVTVPNLEFLLNVCEAFEMLRSL